MEQLKGFEGLYSINREGVVMSCRYNRELVTVVEEGYLRIQITDHTGCRHTARIHRLLAIQYLPNPDNLPEIDHIDRNRLNNNLSNLRWVSRIVNANNKSNNLTEEEKAQRKIEIMEYKRNWATAKRRVNGVQPKQKIKTADEKKYKREKAQEYRAQWSDEKREAINIKKKESYSNEKQQEYVNRPDVKQRRLDKQTQKRKIVSMFKMLPFANFSD
jgi:hypothetical protein